MLRHAIIVTAFCGSRDTETCTIVKWVVRAVILLFFRVDFVSFEWGTCRCERDGDSGGSERKRTRKPTRIATAGQRSVEKGMFPKKCVNKTFTCNIKLALTLCVRRATVGGRRWGMVFFRKEFDGRVTAESPSAGHNGPLWLWPRMVNLL
jgi:hypothetical protein